MPLSQAETELRDQFDASYQRHQTPVMQCIERTACGCDFGGTSWATREEIDQVQAILGLQPGQQLLDLGAGSGWPGIYLSAQSGCDISLVDLPPKGLAIAAERAKKEQLSGTCQVTVADGRALPYANGYFDAINHSDVLCCLPDKFAVLKECRRVTEEGGKMVFSVIFIAENLTQSERQHAIDYAPPYAASDLPYVELLQNSGWEIIKRLDMSEDYLATVKTIGAARRDNEVELTKLLGAEEFDRLVQRNPEMVEAISRGLVLRALYATRAI